MEQSLWQPSIGEEVTINAPKFGNFNTLEEGSTGTIIEVLIPPASQRQRQGLWKVLGSDGKTVGKYYGNELKPYPNVAYHPSQEGDRDDDV